MKRSPVLALAASLIVISPVFAEDNNDKIHEKAVSKLRTSQPQEMSDDELAEKILDELPPPVQKSPVAKSETAVVVGKGVLRGIGRFCAGYNAGLTQSMYAQPRTILQPIIIQQTSAPYQTIAPLVQSHTFSSTRIGNTVWTRQHY